MDLTLFLDASVNQAGLGLGTWIIHILINAVALMAAAYILEGVTISDFTRAILLAVVLAVLNSTLGAVLDFVSTPLRWITLGLFSVVVDAIVLKVADYFMKGFSIRSFSWALLLAVVLAIFNTLSSWIFF
ncbi:MAG: phage holin family protein [Saprospiraceae bacterium]|nr:phage holin family protein [Lewinella sp.]